MDQIIWGILSTAKIGVEKVIPAIQRAENCTVKAISSRTEAKAIQAAEELGIPNAYGSYEQILEDTEIEAIYNPLPNHLHVPKTIQALEAGKHVLCEKPIAMDAREARQLLEISSEYPNLKVMEAFMYRFHPQWKKAKSLVESGKIGTLQTIESFFSYFNENPDDIRNSPNMGGGGLMDIGCYCISLSRFLFEKEPISVDGTWKIDSDFGTDYLASGILDFGNGTATFSCATQTAADQRVHIVGTKGRIIIDIPFNAPPTDVTRLWLIHDGERKELTFKPVDQYTQQATAFARSLLEDKPVPTPLEDALNNMKAIDAFRKSARDKD